MNHLITSACVRAPGRWLVALLASWIACSSAVAPVLEVSAQVVGPNMNISGGTSPEVENSPSIATMGNNIAAVWSLGGGGGGLRAAVSRDGGFTWADSIVQPGLAERVGGRASTSIDSRRNVYCAVNGLDGSMGTTIFIYSGSLDAAVWQWERRPNALPFGQGSLDGIRIVCDRSTDFLYLAYQGGGRIHFVRSTDGGESWSLPLELSGSLCNTAQLAIGPEGELYVVWEDYAQEAIVGRKSTDHGVSFGADFRLGTIQDNIGFGPPGWQDRSRSQMLPHVTCMDFPAFLGLAVDTSAGPNRGTVYGVWTEHALGTVNPDPVRTLSETEPNHFFVNATPIQIGDDFGGVMGSADLPPYIGDCDWFTFEGTAGTTIQITGTSTGCHPAGGCQDRVESFTLYCGTDTTQVTRLGCGQAYGPSLIPPTIYTLPTTGRYYLDAGCSAASTISYTLSLREYVVNAGQAARDHRDVVLVRSTDGGATWSDKLGVNDDAPRYDNAIPAVTVDGSGRVHVAWYDRREEPECGARVRTAWTWSEDGGATFQPSRRVSEQPSEGGRYDGPSQGGTWQVGDHLALQAEGERVYLLWTYIPIGVGGGEIYGVVIDQSAIGLPEINSVSPIGGGPGSLVEIRGLNLAPVTGVFFHNSFANFTLIDDGLITAEVPATARTGYIAVTNPPRIGRSPAYFFVAPRITALLPSRGPVGQVVRIVGENFTGATELRFNGLPASFTVMSDTLIQTTVPPGTTNGPVEVTAPGGTASTLFELGPPLESGINLAWEDCGSHGASLQVFACNRNVGSAFTLIASFTPPEGVGHIVGISADLRIISDSAALPNWWRLGTCRFLYEDVIPSVDFAAGPTSCQRVQWQLQDATYQDAYDGASHARLFIRLSAPEVLLDPAFEHYALKVAVHRNRSTGPSVCPGCTLPVRVELRSIQLHQPTEVGFDPVITNPLVNNVAYWQSDPTPVMVSVVSSEAGAEGTRVIWHTEDVLEATVYRRREAEDWAAVSRLSPDGSGRIVFVDPDVQPGTRYGYRLGIASNGREVFVGETEVTLQHTAALAVTSLRRGDGTHGAVIVLTLPSGSPASLEVYDVAGRLWGTRRLEGLTAGRHEVAIPGRQQLSPGVYFVRLAQSGSTTNRRFPLP
jgi:hypothetical protein